MNIDDVLQRIAKVVEIVFFLCLTGFISFWFIYGTDYVFGNDDIPYDDLSSHVKEITCRGSSCNITFDAEVYHYYKVAETGSMVPLIGGNDWVICLNASNMTVNLGDYVITPFALHMVYDKDGEWFITKGYNNQVEDPYKVPRDDIRCVVGAVLR